MCWKGNSAARVLAWADGHVPASITIRTCPCIMGPAVVGEVGEPDGVWVALLAPPVATELFWPGTGVTVVVLLAVVVGAGQAPSPGRQSDSSAGHAAPDACGCRVTARLRSEPASH